jgi:hypothetical protein
MTGFSAEFLEQCMMSAFLQIFSEIYGNFRKNCKLTLYANRFPFIYTVNTLTGAEISHSE